MTIKNLNLKKIKHTLAHTNFFLTTFFLVIISFMLVAKAFKIYSLDLENHTLSSGYPVFIYNKDLIKVYTKTDKDSTYKVWNVVKGQTVDWRRSLVKNIPSKTIVTEKSLIVRCINKSYILTEGQTLKIHSLDDRTLLYTFGQKEQISCQGLRKNNEKFISIINSKPSWWLFIHSNQDFKKGWILVNETFKTQTQDSLTTEHSPKFNPDPVGKIIEKLQASSIRDIILVKNISNPPEVYDLSLGSSGEYGQKLVLIFDENRQNFNGVLTDKRIFGNLKKDFLLSCVFVLEGKKEKENYNIRWWLPKNDASGDGLLSTKWQAEKSHVKFYITKEDYICPQVFSKPDKPIIYPLNKKVFDINLSFTSFLGATLLPNNNLDYNSAICLDAYTPVYILENGEEFLAIKTFDNRSGYIPKQMLFASADIAKMWNQDQNIKLAFRSPEKGYESFRKQLEISLQKLAYPELFSDKNELLNMLDLCPQNLAAFNY